MAAGVQTNELRGIKPPLSLPDYWFWLWVGVGLLLAAVLLVWWWRRRRQTKTEPSAAPAIAPADRARRRIEAASRWLSDPERFCVEVSAAIRCYFEEQFHYHAPERTTEEFLAELSGATVLAPEQCDSLKEFLVRCDLVKFARYEPMETELHGLLKSAIKLVNSTEPPPSAPAAGTNPVAPGTLTAMVAGAERPRS
jgi:hypothetical protein